MITAAIINFSLLLAMGLLSPLLLAPDVSLTSAISNSIATASNSLATVNAVVPLGAIVLIVSSYLAIEGSIFTYKFIKWIYQKIPGVN